MLLPVNTISVILLYPIFVLCTYHLLQFKHKPSDMNVEHYQDLNYFMEESIHLLYISFMHSTKLHFKMQIPHFNLRALPK